MESSFFLPHVHVYMCTCVQAHVYTCMWMSEVNSGCVLQFLWILFIEAGSLTEPAGRELQGPTCLCLFRAVVTDRCCHAQFFRLVLRCKVRLSSLCGQALYCVPVKCGGNPQATCPLALTEKTASSWMCSKWQGLQLSHKTFRACNAFSGARAWKTQTKSCRFTSRSFPTAALPLLSCSLGFSFFFFLQLFKLYFRFGGTWFVGFKLYRYSYA